MTITEIKLRNKIEEFQDYIWCAQLNNKNMVPYLEGYLDGLNRALHILNNPSED